MRFSITSEAGSPEPSFFGVFDDLAPFDAVVIRADTGRRVAVDNLAFGVANVPEPAAALLMIRGAGVLARRAARTGPRMPARRGGP